LHIAGKIQASVFNNDISLKTFFIVTKDINHTIIIGTLFIDMITPYQAHHNCITSKINNIKLIFSFLEKSKTRNVNLIKACSIYTYHINALIHGKQFHLHDLFMALQKVSQQASSDSVSQTGSISKSLSKPLGGISASKSLISLQQTSFSKTKSKYIFKTTFQNILTMEEGFYHQNPSIAASKIFPPN